jgi:hypothetical protein
MKLLKVRNIALTGVVSVAGLGLIGAGAHAVFTTSTSSAQTITAGTLSVAVSSPGGTCTTLDAYGSCNAISLTSAGPEASTFDSGPVTVTVTNEGTVSASEISVAFGDTVGNSAGTAMAAETYACITSDGSVLENGLVSTIAGYGFAPYPLPNGTAPHNTDMYTVEYYAGAAATLCGAGGPGAPVLVTPAANPAAGTLGLDNAAQGGVITPSVTLQYQA